VSNCAHITRLNTATVHCKLETDRGSEASEWQFLMYNSFGDNHPVHSGTPEDSPPSPRLSNRSHKDSIKERYASLLGPPGSNELRWAFAVVLLSILAFAAAVPFARVPLTEVVAFIPSYEAALAISDLVTAVLLFSRPNRGRSNALLALASGYLFNAAIIIVHALSFPRAFSESGLFGANDQTTALLYIFWHIGFPLLVLAYALLPVQDAATDVLRRHTARTIALSATGVIAIVTALTLLATVGSGLLPKVIETGNYSLLISTGASPTAVGLSALALLALWRRSERDVLDVWLMVVMTAWLLDIILSSVISSSRYD
jgi:MYXO-CTERM domain-containing protein